MREQTWSPAEERWGTYSRLVLLVLLCQLCQRFVQSTSGTNVTLEENVDSLLLPFWEHLAMTTVNGSECLGNGHARGMVLRGLTLHFYTKKQTHGSAMLRNNKTNCLCPCLITLNISKTKQLTCSSPALGDVWPHC